MIATYTKLNLASYQIFTYNYYNIINLTKKVNDLYAKLHTLSSEIERLKIIVSNTRIKLKSIIATSSGSNDLIDRQNRMINALFINLTESNDSNNQT